MIIARPEAVKRLNANKKWLFIYGRRKTGKTFLVKNFGEYDEYFFIKRDRTIISKKGDTMSYATFLEVFKVLVDNNKKIIVDEFHRLGDDFFDYLHYTDKKGRVILISSTLYLSKKILSQKSALLGLFEEYPLGIIDLKDSLEALKKLKYSKKDLLELAIFMREPLAIDYLNEDLTAKETITNIVSGSVKTVPGLIGEIFIEEEKNISAIYEGILRAIASGKNASGKISNYLFSKKLIKKDDPSTIQQYLNNLISFGILKRIKIFNKNRYAYQHVSPLAWLFYYADEKYNIAEREVNKKELEEIINNLLPKIVETNVRERFAKKHGLIEHKYEEKNFDVDLFLTKFKKPELIGEIKWKNKVSREDIKQTKENLSKFKSKQKILFVPDKQQINAELPIMDVTDL